MNGTRDQHVENASCQKGSCEAAGRRMCYFLQWQRLKKLSAQSGSLKGNFTIRGFLGKRGGNTVSRELTEFCAKLSGFSKDLGEFALAHK